MSNLFESETCSRCGGSGHYSYCQRYGTICFKCGGKKTVLTKRGYVAQRFYNRLLSRAASTLKPGDQIWETVFLGDGVGSKWHKVEAVVPREDGTLYIETKGMAFAGVHPDHRYRVRAIHAAVREGAQIIALGYQSYLSKSGKEPKWLGQIAWG